MSCLLIGAVALTLSGDRFTLEWTHSVEKVAWREEWIVNQDGMRLMIAAVKGSGAGMEPGPDARLQDGWLVWQPKAPPVRELALAASGATGGGWRICGAECVVLGQDAGAPLVLRPCPA